MTRLCLVQLNECEGFLYPEIAVIDSRDCLVVGVWCCQVPDPHWLAFGYYPIGKLFNRSGTGSVVFLAQRSAATSLFVSVKGRKPDS